MKLTAAALILASVMASASALSDDKSENNASMTVTMHALNEKGTGKSIGEVAVRATEHGLVFDPALSGLSPGMHGFHVHENPSCDPVKKEGDVTPGGAAGSHYDPKESGHHHVPWGEGHLGDLPALYVDSQGTATTPVLSPRLSMKDLKGASLMIHANGDNYSDKPKPLGGGGGRVACGVFGE